MVAKQALSYFGHVMRADGLEKSMMLGKVAGNRRRGRQRTRWLDTVVEESGCELVVLKEKVKDRNGWRVFVKGVTRGRARPDGT